MEDIFLAFVGMFVGALSGFFGIGGGTILVPILLLTGLEMKVAVGISIMQMTFSSIFGSYLNYRKGSLEIGEGLFVGFGGFVGGYLSAYMTPYISSLFLQYIFIAFVLFVLYRVMVSTEPHEDVEVKSLPKILLFGIGVVIGLIAISIGVGGAIILIPLLSGLLHYPIKKAASAGLFFVVFSSVAGIVGRLMHSEIDLYRGFVIGVASLFGVFAGIWLKDKTHTKNYKVFLFIMYLFVLSIMSYKMFFDI